MKRPIRGWLALAIAAWAAAEAAVIYARAIRPWHSRWGATDDEVEGPMPLDERIPEPRVTTTRAVSIAAPPDEVWPWIVQMGDSPRAGYYSYTLIERAQGMDVENADRILPEYQTLEVGDHLDKAGTMEVLGVEPGKHLVLGGDEDWLDSTWAFAVFPEGDGGTRLVTRLRANISFRGMLRHTPPYTWPFWLLIDPGVFIMERKMLLEIKRRAETHAQGDSPAA